MKETLLCLEEKCLLSLFSNSGKISFYCNGFNVVDTLLSFSDLQDIVVANLLLEEGAGVDYRSYTIENLPIIESYSTLKDTFKKLSCDVFIYDLSFSSRDISVAIHDNRDFSILEVMQVRISCKLRDAKLRGREK